MSFGASPVDSNNIPIGSAYAPQATSGGAPAVLRGGNKQTDGGSNVSEAAAFTMEDGWKPTYSVTMPAQAVVAGDIFQMTGSATKTVKLTRILLSANSGTAAQAHFTLVRRSSADSAGTAVALTIVPNDSGNPTVSAVVTGYSAAPTQGTTVGTLRAFYLPAPITAGAGGGILELKFDGSAQQPTLRGTSQFFALTISAGATIDLTVEWTEDSYS